MVMQQQNNYEMNTNNEMVKAKMPMINYVVQGKLSYSKQSQENHVMLKVRDNVKQHGIFYSSLHFVNG